MSNQLRTSYLIKRLELLVRTRLEEALRDFDITTGQYAALSLLAKMPAPSSAQLARSIGVTPQTITDTILNFEERRLISRERSSEHKRILRISLTEDGRVLLKQCEKRATQVEDELFAALNGAQLDDLRASLLAVLHSVNELRD
ncbi:MAG: MarR family transcriptional regulator [Sphingobium sp.]|nr:MAG: MarR family transcriptional regulator [Sphingobium sp.]